MPICISKYHCTKEAAKNRKICNTCKTKLYREKYPLKYWYDTLKMNSKRRGKKFTLTLKEFSDFCNKTGYSELKGITADSLTVDRVDNNKGYSAENIRAITLSENIKRNYHPELEPESDCPF